MSRKKRNYQSNRKVEHIGDLMGRYLQINGLGEAMRDMDIVRKWPQIAGERIAAVTECRDVTEGVVRVYVKSAAWRQELVFMKGDLIKAICRETGTTSIKDIVFF